MTKSIALVGDYNKNILAHLAIPQALEFARKFLNTDITWSWIETAAIRKEDTSRLAEFSAIWVVPGSPYAHMDGALSAIRFARETGRPFLGTCGGFQHALIEYARNVCDEPHADHAETNSESTALVITPLSCSLVEKTGQILFFPGSRLHSVFGGQPTMEGYHCNYGLNSQWKQRLESAGLRFTGLDTTGEVRAFELPGHPFFVGTLFQPERSAFQGKQHPLIRTFVESVSNLDTLVNS